MTSLAKAWLVCIGLSYDSVPEDDGFTWSVRTTVICLEKPGFTESSYRFKGACGRHKASNLELICVYGRMWPTKNI